MNAAEKLAREIWRVSAIAWMYREIGAAGQPALILMNSSLEQACKAAGSNDALAVIAALRDLEGYSE